MIHLDSQDTWSEQDQQEFEKLCAPVVEFIQRKFHPHTRIIIDWDRASIFEEQFGLPFQVPD